MRLGNPKLAVDTRLEEEGKWVDLPSIWWIDEARPMRVLLKGANTRAHQSVITSLTKGLTREQQIERAVELSAELAVALVAGWENWIDTDGEPIRYSVETCRSILCDPDNRRVVDFINRTATDLSTFDVEAVKEKEKNS